MIFTDFSASDDHMMRAMCILSLLLLLLSNYGCRCFRHFGSHKLTTERDLPLKSN